MTHTCNCGSGKKFYWVRATQFTGDHLFCEICGPKEADFKTGSNGGSFWQTYEELLTYQDETKRKREVEDEKFSLELQMARKNKNK